MMAELYDIAVQFPYSGMFFLLILGGIGFPFPEDAILLSCGLLISRQTIQPFPAFLSVYAGILISDFIIYSLGRKYGRALLTCRRFRKVLPEKKLLSLESRYRRFGLLTIVLGRQIAGVRAQTILAAGILGMPWRSFLMTDAFASLMTIMLMVSLGYAGAENLLKIHSPAVYAGYLPAIVLLLAITVFLARRHKSKHRTRTITDRVAIGEMQI